LTISVGSEADKIAKTPSRLQMSIGEAVVITDQMHGRRNAFLSVLSPLTSMILFTSFLLSLSSV
jgi:hypothetical protein